MGQQDGWPVQLETLGKAAVGGTLWRLDGQLMVTVIAKMTCEWVEDGPMKLVASEPLHRRDQHEGGHPMKSLRRAAEIAPQLNAVDIVLTGSAHAPPEAKESMVRLLVAGANAPLIDKTLKVLAASGPSGQNKPFESLRLSYEQAYGGIGYPSNPIGTGFGADTAEPPRIVFPSGPSDRVAGLGPIPMSFPARRKLLGTVSRKQVSATVATIPASFDWNYFQAAPQDQRVAALSGNEWLVIEGVDPERPRRRSRLPGTAAVSKIYGFAETGVPDQVPLRIDTLHIDAEAWRCTLLWRGSFPLFEEASLTKLVVAVGFVPAGTPMAWPSTLEELRAEAHDGRGSASPPSSERSAGPVSESALDGTMIMSAEHPLVGSEHPLAGTMAVSAGALAQAAAPLPFGGSARSGMPSKKTPIPGAPWSAESASQVRPPKDAAMMTMDANAVSPLAHLSDDEARVVFAQQQAAKQDAKAAESAQFKVEQEQKARERARRQAEERRKEDANAFSREQEAAQREEQRLSAAEAETKKRTAKKLRDNMYGGFKRKS